eukprot:1836514-Pleurochrysis_carterae.AAC.1
MHPLPSNGSAKLWPCRVRRHRKEGLQGALSGLTGSESLTSNQSLTSVRAPLARRCLRAHIWPPKV